MGTRQTAPRYQVPVVYPHHGGPTYDLSLLLNPYALELFSSRLHSALGTSSLLHQHPRFRGDCGLEVQRVE